MLSGLHFFFTIYSNLLTCSAPRPGLGPQINLCICELLRGLETNRAETNRAETKIDETNRTETLGAETLGIETLGAETLGAET